MDCGKLGSPFTTTQHLGKRKLERTDDFGLYSPGRYSHSTVMSIEALNPLSVFDSSIGH